MRFIRRYKSEIYGNYRRAALAYGSLTGGLMAVCVLVASLVGMPFSAPETYVTDGVMALSIFVSAYYYRRRLNVDDLSQKELLLMGLDMGIVIGIVYGLLLWVVLLGCYPALVSHFAEVRINQMVSGVAGGVDEQLAHTIRCYNAADWAFIGAFRSFVLSILFSFFAALIFGTRPKVSA